MNKKGICAFWGYYLRIGEAEKLIKENGFDCVITNADKKFDYQNGTIAHQMKLFKKYGLEVSSLHMAYHGKDLRQFWKDTPQGDELERNLIRGHMFCTAHSVHNLSAQYIQYLLGCSINFTPQITKQVI